MNLHHFLIRTLSVAFAATIVACSSPEVGQANFDVIPLPQEVTHTDEAPFMLSGRCSIGYPADNAELKRNAELLAQYIEEATGNKLPLVEKSGSNPDLTGEKSLIFLTATLEAPQSEAYRLTVDHRLIFINGATPAGTFYGIQTLRKALPMQKKTVEIPATVVNDYPRFSYRGAMLDTSRHFFTTDSLKRFVDLLAMHNINRFHWHITDDQGWRLEVKSHPELTTVGSKRKQTVIGRNSGKYDGKPYEGFYTQAEAREIVAYAAERHITVIPEVDLPGHMLAALAAYPELGCTGGPYEVWCQWGVSEDVLCAGNEKIYSFLEDVFTEVMDIFPSEYIHIGGDECPKLRWKACPKCQAKIHELGIRGDQKHTAEQYLQSYVIGRVSKFLESKGRKIIGWDEILEGGLNPGATVMSWTGVKGGLEAARQGHDAIMTPISYLYLNMYQSRDTEHEPLAQGGYIPVDMVYSYEPVPSELTPEQAEHIIGVQANVWCEQIKTMRHVEYMELPRLAAAAEVQWTQPGRKNFECFVKRLPQLMSLYDRYQYVYGRHLMGVTPTLTTDTTAHAVQVKLTTLGDAPIYYTLDGSEPTNASTRYTEPISITQTCTLKAMAVHPATGELMPVGSNGAQANDLGKGGSEGSGRTPTRTLPGIMSQPFTFNLATAHPTQLLLPPSPNYQFDGAITLVDGRLGSDDFSSGQWLGFHGTPLSALVDLGEAKNVSSASVRCLVQIGLEIFDARSFGIELSTDGKSYRTAATENYPVATAESKDGIFTHTLKFAPTTARYVRFTVKPEVKIGAWHWGKGRPAFIFVDELIVE